MHFNIHPIKVVLTMTFVFCMMFRVDAQFNPKPDSITKKYGPHTTTYCAEEDYLYNNSHNPSYIDTVMQNGHLYQSYFKFEGAPYQDLGAFGSSQIAYYQEPDEFLGTQFGLRAWDNFIYSHNDVKYFDTYSPYSRLEYVQALNGGQVYDVGFSRSTSENFNFGFALKGFGSNKTIGRNTEGQRFTDNLSANINARIVSNNKRYMALVNFRYFKQKQDETGGYYADSTNYNYFNDQYPVANLVSPETNMRENTFRLYHQFNISKDTVLAGKVQVFNEIERKKQRFWYVDDELNSSRTEINGKTNGDFYNNIYFDSTITNDSSTFHVLQTKAGLKGTIGNIYYQGFFRTRFFKQTIYDSTIIGWDNESFVGGAIRYKVGDSSQIDFEPQYQVGGVSGSQPMYNFIIRPRYKWFELELQSQSQAPDAIQNYYVGNHFLWGNSFKNKRIDRAEFSFIYRKGKLLIHPFVGVDRFQNFIYYDQNVLPEQQKEAFLTYHAGFRFATNLGNLNYYKKNQSTSPISVPDFFWYQQVYFESHFKNNLFFQLGADLYYRSKYNAYGFNPAIQQFHLQSTRESGNYVVVDAFMNFRLKSALLFLKVPHVNQLVEPLINGGSNKGYEITPYYPGIAPTFVFGVEWMFFD